MRLVNRWSQAAKAADAWRKQYSDQPYWRYDADSPLGPMSREELYHRLVAMGASPSPDDVDELIGNRWWTFVPACSECSAAPQEVVAFGNTFWLCAECLLKAMMLINP